MKSIHRRGLMSAGALCLAFAVAACSQPEQKAAETAAPETSAEAVKPAYATLTIAAGKTPPVDLVAKLTAAKIAGLVRDFTLVASRPSAEGPVGFGEFAVIEFTDTHAYDAWMQGDGRSLGADVTIKPADILVDERASAHSPSPVYVVNHYDALIAADAYRKYTVDYIGPNMAGQKAGGVLAGWAMYYETQPTGAHHRTVLVKEYVDEAAFGRIDAVKGPNEERLMKDPNWARIAATKSELRTDVSATKAVPVVGD